MAESFFASQFYSLSSSIEMIVLLDTSPSQGIKNCGLELDCEVGQLLTPLTRYRLQHPEMPWAIDNGAFSRFEERAFMALLEREHHHRQNCKFVCAPDVVGSARRTIEVFQRWIERLSDWPVALVLQDGQEDLDIPWDAIAAVFLGGTNNFKLSDAAMQCLKAAKILNKWVHVGRINDPARFAHFEDIADSCDGTGISRYTHMREAISKRRNQHTLELET